MVNKQYEPTDREKLVLELIYERCRSNELLARVNPLYIRKQPELGKRQVEFASWNGWNASWICQINQRELYTHLPTVHWRSESHHG